MALGRKDKVHLISLFHLLLGQVVRTFVGLLKLVSGVSQTLDQSVVVNAY